MNDDAALKSGQIVRLACQQSNLYGEVIQIILSRQMCWVRPLMLVKQAEATPEYSDPESFSMLYDLRQGSDLILPLLLFQPALDTEVIPWLMQLDSSNSKATTPSIAHQQLQGFVHCVCQTYPDYF